MATKLFPGGQLWLVDGKLTFGGGRGAIANAMCHARPPIDDFRIFKYTCTCQACGSIAVLILHLLQSREKTVRYQSIILTLSPPLWMAVFFSCTRLPSPAATVDLEARVERLEQDSPSAARFREDALNAAFAAANRDSGGRLATTPLNRFRANVCAGEFHAMVAVTTSIVMFVSVLVFNETGARLPLLGAPVMTRAIMLVSAIQPGTFCILLAIIGDSYTSVAAAPARRIDALGTCAQAILASTAATNPRVHQGCTDRPHCTITCLRQWQEALVFVARNDNRVLHDLTAAAQWTCCAIVIYMLALGKVPIAAFFITWFQAPTGGIAFFKSASIWLFRHYGIYVVLLGLPTVQVLTLVVRLLNSRSDERCAVQRCRQHLSAGILRMNAEDVQLCRNSGADNQLRWLVESLDDYDADLVLSVRTFAWLANPRSSAVRGLKLLLLLGVATLGVLLLGLTAMTTLGTNGSTQTLETAFHMSIDLPDHPCTSSWPLCPALRFDPSWAISAENLVSDRTVCFGYIPECWKIGCKCTNKPFYFPGWQPDPNAPCLDPSSEVETAVTRPGSVMTSSRTLVVLPVASPGWCRFWDRTRGGARKPKVLLALRRSQPARMNIQLHPHFVADVPFGTSHYCLALVVSATFVSVLYLSFVKASVRASERARGLLR